MSIVPVLLLCSLALVIGSVVLFVFSARQGDCHESDRLCLMPLEDDAEIDAVDHARPASGSLKSTHSSSTEN
ncbi:MAG: cytochrome oxidase [Planctomycetota bacterium]